MIHDLKMMAWLQEMDEGLFRFINQSLVNPVFDWLMPLLSGGPRVAGFALFIPAVVAVGLLLLWKGGRRGRLFVVFVTLAVILGDPLVINSIKKSVARPRPCVALADTRTIIGCSDSGSMPSAHAANWFAGSMVAFIFYRRSWRFMLPMAATVAFSRVYNGVHYPSDVTVGAILGAGYSAAGVWTVNRVWGWAGRKWFPLWWQRQPSLMFPDARVPAEPTVAGTSPDQHWLRLGYVFIGVLLLFRLGYVASSTISLSADEAGQWLGSKHLASGYPSAPPGIAYLQFAGTWLWGDTQLGVRFFSPIIAATVCLLLLRFMAREANARLGFLLLLIVTATPLIGIGSILMTSDSPLVLCWTVAMIAGWRAVQPEGTTRQWLIVGAALGLGFLSNYRAAYLIVCFALFFAWSTPARVHLRRPGPYLAMAILALSALPVIIWNSNHDWITVRHMAENAGMTSEWKPTLRYFRDFLLAEGALLNPVFFAGALWASVAFWKQRRPLWVYFFCLGTPVFLGHWAWSLHSRILPNWIATAVLPMFCLMAVYWEDRWRAGVKAVKIWMRAGLILGLIAIVFMHESKYVGKVSGNPLPAAVDPLRTVRAWKETGALVERARQTLLLEGKPVFILCDQYGMVGELSFYLPEARAAVGAKPLVYHRIPGKADNRISSWPENRYRGQRAGENAIYVTELPMPPPSDSWFYESLFGKELNFSEAPAPIPVPPRLFDDFESVNDLGVFEAKLGKRVFRRVQLFECRNLR